MSLAQHLVELRKRLFLAAGAIILGMIGGYFLAPFVLEQLQVPINALSEEYNAKFNYTTLTEAFDIRLQMSFLIGLVATSPIWLYQIGAFIVPALVRRERVYLFGFFGAAVPLFLGGAVVGWILFPHMVAVLLSFTQSDTSALLSAKYIVDFVVKLVIAVGIGFTLPVFLVLLNFIGILSAKSILKGWRVAILLIALFTALVTPSSDVVSMFLLAIPMVILYFLAAGVAWLHDRSVARRAAALDAELAST
jgi:sec-independent protein translocase protein TatC